MIPGAEKIGGTASVGSPNGARGSGGGTLSTPSGGLRGRSLLRKFFGFQRALDSLKIDSNFINCGCEARYKLKNSMELRNNIIVKKNQLINVITQY